MTPQGYLDEVARIIRECFRPADASGGMPVATVAYLVKQRLDVEHAEFGFFKFKNVLAELESRGCIRTGANAKGAFAIWLADSPPATCAVPAGTQPTEFRALRNPVWFAFVSDSPQGRRFLNRRSGEVVLGQQQGIGPDWVEIAPVNDVAEREEARKFISAHHLDSSQDVLNSVASDRWYARFPETLAKADPRLASQWKRQRSNRILLLVKDWQEKNQVEDHLVFDQKAWRNETRRWERRQPSNLRQFLFEVLERMSTDKLLDVEVPARLLIEQLRPDLLNS